MANPKGFNLFINTKAVYWEFTVVVPIPHSPKGKESDHAPQKSGFSVASLKIYIPAFWKWCLIAAGAPVTLEKTPNNSKFIQKWSEMTNIKEALAVTFQKPRPGVSREWEPSEAVCSPEGQSFP